MFENEHRIMWNPSAPAEREKLALYVLEKLDDIARIFHEAKKDLKELTRSTASAVWKKHTNVLKRQNN